MISLEAMATRVRDRLVKDRRTIKSLKAKLVISRLANAKLRRRAKVDRSVAREAARQLREFRKKQLPLPLGDA